MSESKLPEYESKQPELTNEFVSSAKQLVQCIITKQKTVKQLYEQYNTLDAAGKLETGRKIIEWIVQHTERKEALYPAMRKILQLGDKAIEEWIAERKKISDDMYYLSMLDKADSEYDEQLANVMTKLTELIQKESSALPLFISGESSYDAQKILTDYENVEVTSLSQLWEIHDAAAKAAADESVAPPKKDMDAFLKQLPQSVPFPVPWFPPFENAASHMIYRMNATADPKSQCIYVLKMVNRYIDISYFQSFHDEIESYKLLSRLQCDLIPNLILVGEVDCPRHNYNCAVIEYVGPTIDLFMKDRRFESIQAMHQLESEMISAVSIALKHFHLSGYVHGDIRLSNIAIHSHESGFKLKFINLKFVHKATEDEQEKEITTIIQQIQECFTSLPPANEKLNTEAPVASSTRSKVDMSESKLPEYESKQPELKNKSVGSSAPAEILVQRIISEHNTVKQLYSQYPNLDAASKLDTGRKIIELIVQHAGREECVLYPAMRKIPELGDKAVNEAIAEHQQTTNDLYELSKLNKADSKFDTQLQKIMKELCDHIAEEESSMLPLFISGASNYDAQQILTDYQNVTVTSLPHPWAPREGLHLTAKAAHVASVPIDENAIDINVKSAAYVDSPSQHAHKKQKLTLTSSKPIHPAEGSVITPPQPVAQRRLNADDVTSSMGRVLVWRPIMEDSPEDDDPFANPKALGEWQIAGSAVCIGHANLMVTARHICFQENRQLILRVLHTPLSQSPKWYRAQVIRHDDLMDCCVLFLQTQASSFRPVDESHIVAEDDPVLKRCEVTKALVLLSYPLRDECAMAKGEYEPAFLQKSPSRAYGEIAVTIRHLERMVSDSTSGAYLHPGWRTATATYELWDYTSGGGVFFTQLNTDDRANLIGIHLGEKGHGGRLTSWFVLLDSVFKCTPLWNLNLLISEAEQRKFHLLPPPADNVAQVHSRLGCVQIKSTLKRKESEPSEFQSTAPKNTDCLYDE